MAISGKRGRIQYGGADVGNLNSWNMDIAADTHDVTAWTTDNAQWRTFISGLSGWSGSIAGFWDFTGSTNQKDLQDNILTPTTALLTLYMNSSGGENLRGSVLLTSQSVGVSIGGVPSLDYDFQGTGTPTYSTAT